MWLAVRRAICSASHGAYVIHADTSRPPPNDAHCTQISAGGLAPASAQAWGCMVPIARVPSRLCNVLVQVLCKQLLYRLCIALAANRAGLSVAWGNPTGRGFGVNRPPRHEIKQAKLKKLERAAFPKIKTTTAPCAGTQRRRYEVVRTTAPARPLADPSTAPPVLFLAREHALLTAHDNRVKVPSRRITAWASRLPTTPHPSPWPPSPLRRRNASGPRTRARIPRPRSRLPSALTP